MPVPDYESLMLPVLNALSGGAETPLSGVRASVAVRLERPGIWKKSWMARKKACQKRPGPVALITRA